MWQNKLGISDLRTFENKTAVREQGQIIFGK